MDKFVTESGLASEELKFDFYEPQKEGQVVRLADIKMCYALYKKWSINGPFELSGYSLTQSYRDIEGGLDEFIMPILVNKSYAEIEDWKKSALKAAAAELQKQELPSEVTRKGAGKPVKEKREAEAFLRFTQQAYSAVKPKTKRERHELKIIAVLAIIWIVVMIYLVPGRPKLVEHAQSVSWLPGVTDISYFRAPDLVIFEGKTSLENAMTLSPGTLKPGDDGVIARYIMFKPESSDVDANKLASDSDEFERWQGQFQAKVSKPYAVSFPDGSRLLYDSMNNTLYGYLQGETLKQWPHG